MLASIVIGLLTRDLEPTIQIRILYFFPACFSLFQTYLQASVYLHESPKYLVQKGMMKECEESLASIYNSFEAINQEVLSLVKQKSRPPASYTQIFGRIYSTQLCIGCSKIFLHFRSNQ